MPRTSFDAGHSHFWSKDRRITSLDNGHRHRIDLRRKVALRANGHTHKLLELRRPKKRGVSIY